MDKDKDKFKEMMENLYREMNVNSYKVNRYEKDKLIIDTCRVFDQPTPYKFETGVLHSDYNNGLWIIVELYKDEAEATIGHNKWVKVMTQEELPYQLKDVSDIIITKIIDKVDGDKWRTNTNKIALN